MSSRLLDNRKKDTWLAHCCDYCYLPCRTAAETSEGNLVALLDTSVKPFLEAPEHMLELVEAKVALD